MDAKEKQKIYLREKRKKAAERFKNSEAGRSLKEKQRLMRKLAYQKAKNYKLKKEVSLSQTQTKENKEHDVPTIKARILDIAEA